MYYNIYGSQCVHRLLITFGHNIYSISSLFTLVNVLWLWETTEWIQNLSTVMLNVN